MREIKTTIEAIGMKYKVRSWYGPDMHQKTGYADSYEEAHDVLKEHEEPREEELRGR